MTGSIMTSSSTAANFGAHFSGRKLHLLPVEAYTSQEWFDLEQEKIFSNSWRYFGFAEDVSQPGDYTSKQIGLNNICVIMGRDRRLRAFHNICRHRGTQLIRSVGNAQKALTCPYHDWTYNLEGELISVPDEQTEFGSVDKSCFGLKPVSVDIWRSMIFVHPDPNAPSITDFFGPVEQHLGPHDVDNLVEEPSFANSYEIKANWKVVVENYIDVYHLSHLHSGTLAMYDHARAEYGWAGPHYHFREPLAPDYAANVEKNAMGPLVVPVDQVAAYVPMLWPGFGLAEAEASWSIFVITPLGPELSRVENRTRVANVSSWKRTKQALSSAGYWMGASKAKYSGSDSAGHDDPMASGDFTAEDIYACEQQQKSLTSPYFETGPAGTGERPVLDHQRVVAEWMGYTL